MKKVPDEILLEAYSRHNNVWKTAKELGMCGQSVHERLVKLGKNNKVDIFTPDELDRIRNEYLEYRDAGQLNLLAVKMGRIKSSLCRQARILGLIDLNRPRPYAEKVGSNAYHKLHARVRSLRGSPHKCEICGEGGLRKKYDWANLTGKYDDPKDYKRMCIPCHRKYDKNRVMLAHIKNRGPRSF